MNWHRADQKPSRYGTIVILADGEAFTCHYDKSLADYIETAKGGYMEGPWCYVSELIADFEQSKEQTNG